MLKQVPSKGGTVSFKQKAQREWRLVRGPNDNTMFLKLYLEQKEDEKC